MMRLATFLLITLFIAIASSPIYAADRCPRQQTQTSLKSKLAKTRVFKGSSNDFSEYIHGHQRGKNNKVLGFVQDSEIYTTLNYSFDVKAVGEDQYCVNLEKVKGYLYASPKLYLPTDYKKSSCEYKEIRKHEKRHLQAVYDFHKRSTGKYSTKLGRIARKVPVSVPVTTQKEIDQAKKSIENYFENEFRAFEAESLQQLTAIQDKIDSQQEYIGVRRRCNNW